MSTQRSVVYVYGVVTTVPDVGCVEGPSVLSGATFAPPRFLSFGRFTAVVSDLTLRHGVSLSALLENRGNAESLILQHHRVLQGLSDKESVLPFRLGIMFNDDQGVLDALARNHDALREVMEHIDDAVEWGLKIYCARDRLARLLADKAPEIVALKAEIDAAGEGRAFFLLRRYERLVEEAIERAIIQCLKHTGEQLESVVRSFAFGRLHRAEEHGREGQMVFNGACLVSRGRKRAFFELVEDLRGAYSECGFDHEITGPWPPYSFAEYQLGDDEHAA